MFIFRFEVPGFRNSLHESDRCVFLVLLLPLQPFDMAAETFQVLSQIS